MADPTFEEAVEKELSGKLKDQRKAYIYKSQYITQIQRWNKFFDKSQMYFLTLDPAKGRLLQLEMTPMQVRRFRLRRPSARDNAWLRQVLERECELLGAGLQADNEGRFTLAWREVG